MVDKIKCTGCEVRKDRSEFEFLPDKRGVMSPRKQCRVCNGSLGHKPCFSCKQDLPIERFSVVRKPNGPPYPRRDCMKCIYRNRKIAKAKPPRKRGPVAGTRVHARPNTPGWTPPPTLEELARIHARYSPPPWWTPVPGELSA